MANTYTQLYVQFVFTVKGRQNLVKEHFRDELEKVICGIISAHKSKTYAIYCNPDHIHIFVGMHPTVSPSKLMEQVKSGSSNWLNGKKYIPGKFSWQEGFGAFTYSKSHIDNVVKYILTNPNITKNNRSGMNICCWKNLKSTMTINIFLNGMNDIRRGDAGV